MGICTVWDVVMEPQKQAVESKFHLGQESPETSLTDSQLASASLLLGTETHQLGMPLGSTAGRFNLYEPFPCTELKQTYQHLLF